MKKLLAVLLVVAMSCSMCFAEGEAPLKVREGILAYSNMTTDEYASFLEEGVSQNVWKEYALTEPEYFTLKKDPPDVIEYFASFNEMMMALDAGKIDRMELPKPAGEYFMRQNNNTSKYIPYFYAHGVNYYLSMGFLDGNKWFEPFNAAIKAMNEDDTLLLLKAKYIDYAKDDLKPITFEKFPDAETVKIAVTGDMPPIDYIAADGTPVGFNTAILAEIAKRLKVNVELVSINAGARAAALSSGRADGVFYFWSNHSIDGLYDTPEGVELTEPYYSYDTFMYIGKKLHK